VARQPTVAREIESKYDVAPDFVMPDLSAFAEVVAVDTVNLSSTYHDTAEQDLLRYRLTCRRRAGDTDTGWQLKIPGAGERTELHWPSGDEPPEELYALLRPFLRGKPIVACVRLDVTRVRHRLRTPDGELVAEIADDDVRAVGLSAQARAPRWHEVEIELGPAGSRALQAKIGRALLKAGARPSTSRSKLARALVGIGNEGVGTPRTSAGAVLVDYIAQQCDALVAGHFAVQRDADESIHDTRVASRRLRSTLRTFGRCFDAEQATAFEDELKWYASVLGDVRDLEVLHARLAAAVGELPDDLVVGPVADHIDKKLTDELSAARAELLEAMDGERYAQLLAESTRWRDDPPFTAAAGRPASTLHEAVDRIEKTLAKRLAKATRKSSTDEQMHRARKAGKRVRYAAEAATEAGDPRADKIAKRIKRLQDLLGEFQDSVVAAELLRRLASDASERGEDSFTYGVLVAEERQRASQARRRTRKEG
jgi:CHAD domain-containing protein